MRIFPTSTQHSFMIPLCLSIALLLSILVIWAHPYYSNQRLFINVNHANSTANLEDGSKEFSTISKTSDSESSGFDCTLATGDFEPSCRLEIWITDDKTQGMDLSKFETLKVYGNFITPTSDDFLRISLRNHEPTVVSDLYETHYKFNLVELLPSEITQPILVDFKRLIVPNWWLVKVREQNIKSEVDLTNVPLIEISTGLKATIGDYKLRVSAIEFNRLIISKATLYEYLIIFWACLIISSFIILAIFLQHKIRQKLSNKRMLEEINDTLSLRSEKLTLINQTDEMTGTLNRNGMEEKMKLCLNNDWFPMTAVMVDIDYFKRVNDKLGHQKGDEVLISLGSILKEFIQNRESVSRFGGEEFLIIMPQQNKEDVMIRLEKLRKRVESFDMKLGYHLTISIGVSTCTNINQFNKVMEHADAALYDAKNSGRNCVKYYEQ